MALMVALATAPFLYLLGIEKQFAITADASDVPIGAILEQGIGFGLQPIMFASHKFNATKMLFSVRKRNSRHYMSSRIVETLFSRPTSHSYSSGSRAAETPPEPDIYKQQSLALDLCPTGIQCGNSPHSW